MAMPAMSFWDGGGGGGVGISRRMGVLLEEVGAGLGVSDGAVSTTGCRSVGGWMKGGYL